MDTILQYYLELRDLIGGEPLGGLFGLAVALGYYWLRMRPQVSRAAELLERALRDKEALAAEYQQLKAQLQKEVEREKASLSEAHATTLASYRGLVTKLLEQTQSLADKLGLMTAAQRDGNWGPALNALAARVASKKPPVPLEEAQIEAPAPESVGMSPAQIG